MCGRYRSQPLCVARRYMHADCVVAMVERGWPWKYHRREPSYSSHHVDHLAQCEELLLSLAVGPEAGQPGTPWVEQDLLARALTIDGIRGCFPTPPEGWPLAPPAPPRLAVTQVARIVGLVADSFCEREEADEEEDPAAIEEQNLRCIRTLFDLILDNNWRTMQLANSNFLAVVEFLVRDYLSCNDAMSKAQDEDMLTLEVAGASNNPNQNGSHEYRSSIDGGAVGQDRVPSSSLAKERKAPLRGHHPDTSATAQPARGTSNVHGLPHSVNSLGNMLYYLSDILREIVMTVCRMATIDPEPRKNVVDAGIVRILASLLKM